MPRVDCLHVGTNKHQVYIWDEMYRSWNWLTVCMLGQINIKFIYGMKCIEAGIG